MRNLLLLSTLTAFALMMFTGCAATDEPAGTYAAKLPSASGMGRIAIIHIFANGNAMRSNIYIGEPNGDYIENGVWSVKNGIIEIVLKAADKQSAEKELRFKLDGDNLISLKYDEKPFGINTIKFAKIPEVNSKSK